jgi:2-(1,2-epoxy-1,2-dihydrophenyl)acetyl-CoA isomerase
VTAGSYQGFEATTDEHGIALITFNHPERLNAMSFGTRRDLCEVLTIAQLDDAVRVIVLTGTGRGFVAGVNNRQTDAPEPPTLAPDLTQVATREPVNLYSRLVTYAQDPVRTIRRLDKLTIAAVNGAAIQLGLSIVLACDFAVAARSAKMGERDPSHGLAARRGWPLAVGRATRRPPRPRLPAAQRHRRW